MPSIHYDVQGTSIHTFYTGTPVQPGTPPTKSAGKPVLFVHGAGGNGHAWVEVMDRLAGEHSPIAIDLPAHGQSGGSAAAESVDAYCDVVHAFIEAIDFAPFVLVGHSMGGAIAQAYALKYPEQLLGVVLSSTGARLRVAPATLSLWEDASNGLPVETYSRTSYSDKTDIAIVRKGWAEQDKTEARVRLGDYQVCDRFDLMNRTQDINVPTLVLGGADDVVTPVKYAEYLHQRIPGSQLTIIPDAGHASYFEQPDAVVRALSTFLASL